MTNLAPSGTDSRDAAIPRASFVGYWKPAWVPEPLAETLDAAGSKYYRDVSVGSLVWIVTADGPQLLLCGPIEVGWIGSREEAVVRLGRDDLWDAPVWVIAREGTAQLIRRVDITACVPE